MRVSLISPYFDITSLNVRMLSSALKEKGHSVRLVFLQDLDSMMATGVDFENNYRPEVVEQVKDLVQGSDLVGISLMTNYLRKIRLLTGELRKSTSIPVVWGGVHPTVAPERSMDMADYICLGEGEEAMADLADCLERGEEPVDVKNIWFRENGREHRNPLRAPIADMDMLPFPDYDLSDQHILVGRKVVPLSEDILQEMVRGRRNFEGDDHMIYETMWTRGCPHRCTYCINSYYRSLYPGQRPVRRRSVGRFMEELVMIRERFPWMNRMNFMDDDFAGASVEVLSEFRDLYTEKIGFPFFALLSVLSSSEEKLRILKSAGMANAQIGVQSLCEKTNQLYQRKHFTLDKLLKFASSVKRVFPEDFMPTYDLILENPWESTDDVLDTLRGVMMLPKPYALQLYTLTFYPGTSLLDKALEDGYMKEEELENLKENHARRLSYLNLLFMLVNRGIPEKLMGFLAWPPLVRLMESRPARWLISLVEPFYNNRRQKRIRCEISRSFSEFVARYSA